MSDKELIDSLYEIVMKFWGKLDKHIEEVVGKFTIESNSGTIKVFETKEDNPYLRLELTINSYQYHEIDTKIGSSSKYYEGDESGALVAIEDFVLHSKYGDFFPLIKLDQTFN